jgi:MscS family membrane protein
MTNVSIPNADFIKGVVKNYYGRKRFMYKWDLDVPYDVSPERIQGLINAIRELLQDKPEVNQDACWVYLARLDRYAKVVRAWFQVNLPDWSTSLFYEGRLLQEIQKLFESQGIDFAFPTQTLHLKPDAPFLLPELPPEGKAAGRDGNDVSEGE